MIPGASIAVLDDNEDHLRLITRALNAMGAAALPIHFREGRAQIDTPLSSLNLLFVDIHLLQGSSPGPQAYDAVADALERIVDPNCGPYILVSWSTHSGLHDQLMGHLAANLNSDIPPPSASSSLDKAPFLAEGSDPAALAAAIREVIASVPHVSALLEWHDAARIAAGEVVNSLLNLTERNERFTGSNGEALEKLLTAVAREGAGGNAANDRTAAMNEGLGPILTDRLLHGTATNRERLEEAWTAAIPNVDRPPQLGDHERAALNAMTAVSVHDIQHVPAGSRGAVCKLPDRLKEENEFRNVFGCTPTEVIERFITLRGEAERASGKLNKTEKAKLRDEVHGQLVARLSLVGLSAACDHAWGKVPVKKMLLAVEVPAAILADFDFAKDAALFKTPHFNFPDGSGSGFLVFNWRYYYSTPDTDLGVDVAYRVREPLMSHLTMSYHMHGFRLGIPDF